ncbi:hypothetical protein MC885_008998 [Smutsia gigantea]|nr:hypothetical protein MC885_008998 [Smutsia gigantea]
MAAPARAPESPPAADPALAAGAAEEAEEAEAPPPRQPPRQPQPPHNVLVAPRLRAPSSRGLGAAEFGGAAGDAEAPGETFAQRVSLGTAESPPGSFGGRCGTRPPGPGPVPFPGRKFICKLPDKGKKVLGSVVKLKAAIAEREEARGKSELFHPVSLDCKLRQKAVAVIDVDSDKAQNSDQILDTSSLVPSCSSIDTIKSCKATSQQQGLVHPTHKGDEEAPEVEHTVNKCPASSSRTSTPSSSEASECLHQHRVSSQAEDNSSSSDHLFIDRLQRITIVDPDEHHSEENTGTENKTGFGSGTQKKPHYMEVLEIRAQNPVPPPHKFKTNVHSVRLATVLEKARSAVEMQAKLAAQKLAERLNIKTQSYTPEGETWRKYREVRDEDDGPSSDDEF